MRIIFLIMSTLQQPWRDLENNCAQALQRRINQDLETFFVCRGAIRRNCLDTARDFLFSRGLNISRMNNVDFEYGSQFASSNLIEVKITDRWDTMFTKFASAANLVLETVEFDYIVRISPSTFVNLDQLRRMLSGGVEYGGAMVKDKTFASGWASYFSTNAIKKLVSSKTLVDAPSQRLFDDELIGQVMQNSGIKCLPSKTLTFNPEVDRLQLELTEFIRVKSDFNRVVMEREKFSQIEKKLYCG